MTKLQDQLLRIIQQNAARKVALLADQYVRASSAEKETIQAGIRIEKWLSDNCLECL